MMTPSAIPTTANEFIEQQLSERLLALEKAFDAHALCMVGPLIDGVDDLIRVVVEELRARDKREDAKLRLVAIVTTDGGYIETVQRIVDVFRHHYDHISFVIPNYAFSAGTVWRCRATRFTWIIIPV